MGRLRLQDRSKITEEDRKRARELIERLRRSNGRHESLLAKLDPEDAEEIEEVIRTLRKMANETILELTHNNYTNPGRYISELIQNADDCDYSIAKQEAEVPSLRFTLTDDRLTVSSNEDGFIPDNVRAICNMSNSSKKSGKHTGHKGIGFKSVFVVASKVYIRSDPYSFSFTPERVGDERGISLVIPENEESEHLTDREGTRLELNLDPQDIEQRIDELRNLSSSHLLFLKNIRKIVVQIDTRDTEEEIVFVRHDDEVSRVIKQTITNGDSPKENVTRRYLIKCREIDDLPVQVNGPQASTHHVELAFRVDSSLAPLIEKHYKGHVYACLPVKQYDFGFDVNADFHVTSNREDIQDTPRNRVLRSYIAAAFCEQIVQFTQSRSQRYTWLAYYLAASPNNEFWKVLQREITDQLRSLPLFWARAGVASLYAKEVYHIPSCYRDEDGTPLFNHSPEQYLSESYPPKFLTKLKYLGVKSLTFEMFLDDMAVDLEARASRIKMHHVEEMESDDWHRRVTQTIVDNLQESMRKIKKLAFIPLTNGQWVSYCEGIFFDASQTGSAAPKDVKLKLVSDSALPMHLWKPVFRSLGVSPIQSSDIMAKIKEMHIKWQKHKVNFCRTQIKDHLQYLYLNGDKTQYLGDFCLLNHVGEILTRKSNSDCRWYFKQSDNELTTFALLKFCNRSDIQFLHPEITGLIPSEQRNCHGVTWTEWLENSVGVRSVPIMLVRLKRGRYVLSPEFNHVLAQDPTKLPRLLWRNCSAYRNVLEVVQSDIEEIFQCIKIPTAGGLVYPVNATYLPTQDLQNLCKDLHIQGPLLPELADLVNSESSNKDAKKFLTKRLGVRDVIDADFCIKALIELKASPVSKEDKQKAAKEIYILLWRMCHGGSLDPGSRKQLKSVFNTHSLVLCHDSQAKEQQWLPLSECVWDKDGGEFTDMVSIRSQYFGLKKLFVDYLDIKKPSLYMYVRSLEKHLGACSAENMSMIKQILEKISLVIDDNKISSTESDQSSAADIDLDYGSEASSNTDTDSDNDGDNDEESSEGSVSVHSREESFESDSDDNAAFEKLNRGDFRFLPVRKPDGTYKLTSIRAAFVIPDLHHLLDDFKTEMPFLDLTSEQIHACRTLIKCLDLEPKLLSKLGEYETKTIHGCEDEEDTRIFRGKAAAFCGCLKYFTKTSDYDLNVQYERLSNAKIWHSEKISKRFCLTFQSHSYEGTWKQASFHRKSKGKFDYFFVPQDPELRELCDLADFPEALRGLLGIESLEVASNIVKIVKASSEKVAEKLMQDVSIPLWRPFEDDSEIENDNEIEDFDELDIEEQEFSDRSHISEQLAHAPAFHQSSKSACQSMLRRLPYRARSPHIDKDDKYVTILRKVLTEASTIKLPRNGLVSFSRGNNQFADLKFKDVFEKLNWDGDKRHSKVGAAGELFIYDILSRILPDFSFENWTSSIRHHVSGLKEFAEIGEWPEKQETADLQYEDESGTLTKLLQKKQYLEEGSVIKTPYYHIEVKTSVNDCESPFHVSNKQYRLMRENAIEEGTRASYVSMLCRVFHVDHERIGLRIFVDPWNSRGNSLDFTVREWTVKVKKP